jgi:hypothetical protein
MALMNQVQINNDHELVINNAIQDLLNNSMTLEIINQASLNKGMDLYKKARDFLKMVESKRKEAGEPFRLKIIEINDMARKVSEPLDTVIHVLKKKTESYQNHLIELKRKEEEKLREEASLFDADVYIPPLEKVLKTAAASTYMKKEIEIEVFDIKQVPDRYLLIDEVSLKRDYKLGQIDVPGIKFKEVEILQMRTR